jgi:hypothetical protein
VLRYIDVSGGLATSGDLPNAKNEGQLHDQYFRCYTSHRQNRDNSLGIALDDQGSSIRFPAALEIFLFTTASRTPLGPTQPPIQWVPGALSLGLGVKLTTHLHLVPRSKNEWRYTSTPPIRLHGVVLS